MPATNDVTINYPLTGRVNPVAMQHSACDAILAYGIHDERTVFRDFEHYRKAQSFMCRETFESHLKAKEWSASAGIDIVGILGLSFGGTTAERDWRVWRDAFCSSSFEEIAQHDEYRERTRTASIAITTAWSRCIETLAPGSFGAYVVPAQDGRGFRLHVHYKPGPGSPTAKRIRAKENGYRCSPHVDDAPAVDVGGWSTTCTRKNPAESVLIAINSNRGTQSFEIPPWPKTEPVAPQPARPTTTCKDSAQRVEASCNRCSAIADEHTGWGGTARGTRAEANLAPNASASVALACQDNPTQIVVDANASYNALAGWHEGKYLGSASRVKANGKAELNVVAAGYCAWINVHRHDGGSQKGYPGSYLFPADWRPPALWRLIGPDQSDHSLNTGEVVPLKMGLWRLETAFTLEWSTGWAEDSGGFRVSDYVDLRVVRANPDGTCPGTPGE
jgi:hypothetical protein